MYALPTVSGYTMNMFITVPRDKKTRNINNIQRNRKSLQPSSNVLNQQWFVLAQLMSCLFVEPELWFRTMLILSVGTVYPT